jgi:hypothetical protein
MTLGELGEEGIFRALGRVWSRRSACANPELTERETGQLLYPVPFFLQQEFPRLDIMGLRDGWEGFGFQRKGKARKGIQTGLDWVTSEPRFLTPSEAKYVWKRYPWAQDAQLLADVVGLESNQVLAFLAAEESRKPLEETKPVHHLVTSAGVLNRLATAILLSRISRDRNVGDVESKPLSLSELTCRVGFDCLIPASGVTDRLQYILDRAPRLLLETAAGIWGVDDWRDIAFVLYRGQIYPDAGPEPILPGGPNALPAHVCEPVRPSELPALVRYGNARLSPEARRILGDRGTRGVFQALAEVIAQDAPVAKPVYTGQQLEELLAISPCTQELARERRELELGFSDVYLEYSRTSIIANAVRGNQAKRMPSLSLQGGRENTRVRDALEWAHQKSHGKPYLTAGEARWLYENDARYHFLHEQLASRLGVSPEELAAFLRDPTGPSVDPQSPRRFVAGRGVYTPAELILAIAVEAKEPAVSIVRQLQTGSLADRAGLLEQTARAIGEPQWERLRSALLALPAWTFQQGFEPT